MTLERMVPLPCIRIPDFSLAIEGARHDFVTVGVVEGHRIDDISVFIERQELLPGVRIPDLACTIVAAGNEPATALIESAVGQRK